MRSSGIRRRQRVGIGLLAGLVVLWVGYEKLSDYLHDPDTGVRDTHDMLVAIRREGEGSTAVLLSSSGTEEVAPDPKPGATDKEPIWRPDGNRVFLLSDRDEGAFLIHRWNVAKKEIEVRSLGTRSVTGLSWGPWKETRLDRALITQSGFVLEYEPREGTTTQVLPPTSKSPSQDSEGGSTGQIEAVYNKIGKSFRSAAWMPDHESVIALMVTEDDRQVLIRQGLKLVQNKAGEMVIPQPEVLVVGKRVDYDVSSTGDVCAAVMGYDFLDRESIPKEFIKNGKITKPLENGVLLLRFAPEVAVLPVIVVPGNKKALARPKFSPDGTEIAAIGGLWDADGQFTGQAVVRLAAAERSALESLALGNISEIAWHPSGTKLAYVSRVSSKEAAIYVVEKGSAPQKLTSGGEYSSISYSPQLPASK